jgi:valyl-tRNA synthetase
MHAEANATSNLQKASHDTLQQIISNIGVDPDGGSIPRASARAALAGGVEVAVPLEGLIDFAQERARIGREQEKLEKEAQKLEGQLGNPQFVERAPAEKVEELRQRLADVRQRTNALGQMLEALG